MPTSKSAALKGGIDLGLLTAIGEGHNTVAAVAQRCGASERGTRLLCDYRACPRLLRSDSRIARNPCARFRLAILKNSFVYTFCRSSPPRSFLSACSAAVFRGAKSRSTMRQRRTISIPWYSCRSRFPRPRISRQSISGQSSGASSPSFAAASLMMSNACCTAKSFSSSPPKSCRLSPAVNRSMRSTLSKMS